MLKWIVRVVVGLIGLVALAVVGVVIAYSIWINGHIRTLEAESQLIETARGPVEYAEVGEGTPRLMLHGTPGGYDQSLIQARVRPDAYEGVRFIAVSRPGYLRTPVESGRTPAEQADLYAALLDELGIDSVQVYATSGGGASGLQFALRHPDRTAALIMVVPAIADTNVGEEVDAPGAAEALMTDVSMWALGRQFLVVIEPDFDPSDPVQAAIASEMIKTVLPSGPRLEGQTNDLRQFQRLGVDSWPLEGLTVPTLIIHGDADTNAPYAGSASAAARIPGAELITFEGEGHFMVMTRGAEISAHVERFLARLE